MRYNFYNKKIKTKHQTINKLSIKKINRIENSNDQLITVSNLTRSQLQS
jgi:hypothetical protein